MFGLVAVAVMASMAFAVSTASATTLDGPGGILKAGSVIDASLSGLETAKLEAGTTVLDECSGGTLQGVTASETGTFLPGTVAKSSTTWSGCSKTTDTLSGGEMEFHWTSGSNGSFWLSELNVTVNTIFGSCVYGYGLLTKTVGEIKGGSPATLTINTFTHRTSGLCPETATWRANYTITNPSTLKVTS